MQIKFHWADGLDLGKNDELETNMKEWLVSGHGPEQCHAGIVHIFCDSTDELSHTIKGRIFCGKETKDISFVASPNGGTITLD